MDSPHMHTLFMKTINEENITSNRFFNFLNGSFVCKCKQQYTSYGQFIKPEHTLVGMHATRLIMSEIPILYNKALRSI